MEEGRQASKYRYDSRNAHGGGARGGHSREGDGCGGAGRGGGGRYQPPLRPYAHPNPPQAQLYHPRPSEQAFRDLYVEALANKKQYITTSKLLEGSSIEVTQVNNNPLFKYINKVNLIVEKVFFYYWFSRHIHIFAELEKVVVQFLLDHFKRDSERNAIDMFADSDGIITFERFQVGPLYLEPTIKRHFEFEDNDFPPEAPVDYVSPSWIEISKLLRDTAMRHGGKGNAKKHDGKDNKVKQELQRQYRKQVHVDVEAGNYVQRKVYRQFKENEAGMMECVYTEATGTLHQLLYPGPDERVDLIKWVASMFKVKQYANMIKWMSSFDALKDFLPLLHELASTLVKQVKPLSNQQQGEVLWPVDRTWTSNELVILLMSDVKVELRDEEIPTLAACSLGLVFVCARNNLKTASERDAARVQLEAAISEDVPLAIRHFFSLFLTTLFTELDFVVKEDAEKQRKDKIIETIDVNVPAWIENIVTRIIVRSKANSFLSLLMFSVLFARVYYRDSLLCSIGQTPRELKLQELTHAGKKVSLSTNEVLTSNPLQSLLNSLYQLERSFSMSLRVPSFECLGVGSFLRVASNDLRHVVMQHLEPILQHFQQTIGAVDQVNFLGNGDHVITASEDAEIIAPKVEAYEVLSELLDNYLKESVVTGKVWNAVDLLYDLEEKTLECFASVGLSKGDAYASISILSIIVERGELMEKIARLSFATNEVFADSSTATNSKTSHVMARVDCGLPVSQQLQAELLNSCLKQSSTEIDEIEAVRKVMATLHLSEANAKNLLQARRGVQRDPRESLFVTGSVIVQSTLVTEVQMPDPMKQYLVVQLLKMPCGKSVRRTLLWSLAKAHTKAKTLLDLMLLLKEDLAAKKFYVMVDQDDCFKLPTEFSAQDISLLEKAMLREEYHMVAAYMVSALQGLINAAEVTDCLQRMFRDTNDRQLSRVLLICLSLPQSAECVTLFKYFCDKVLLVPSKSELHRKLVTVAMDQPLSCRLLLSTVCATEGLSFSDMVTNIARFGSNWFEEQQEEMQSTLLVTGNPTATAPNSLPQALSSSGDHKIAHSVSTAEHAVVTERKAYVHQLLQREFRYDEHMRKPTMQSPESLKLKKTLELLAADLYKSDVHFVMELIQNADDNKYHDHSTPTIKFVLDLPYLRVLNNEIGFQEDNIDAVCNVGGSTKKGKKGNIGQKGIGFKSVFSVSDFPEIHSNGFHIMFDRHENMIEPIWIEDMTCWPSSVDESSGTYFETCLKLKLNHTALSNMSTLMNNIEDIFQGKLLLFLNKLSHMIYYHPRNHMLTEHRKLQLSDYWVSIQEMQSSSVSHRVSNSDVQNSQESFWFIEQCKFAPAAPRNEVQLDETTVALGFAFKETERRFADQNLPAEEDDDVENNDKQCVSIMVLRPDISSTLLPLYAFLPTEMRYFQFILQADFLLSTSREQVLENNGWNISLLNKVPALFVDLLSEMAHWCFEKDRRKVQCPRLMSIVENGYEINIEASDLLQYLPSENVEMPNDFKHVLKQIHAGLQNVSFLQAWDGEPRSARQLLCVSHLGFNPCTYFNKEHFDSYILPALDYRTFTKDDDDYTLDSRLAHQLGVPLFDGHVVIQALQGLEKQYATSAIGFEIAVELITGLLLCLKEMLREATTMSKSISKGAVVRADFQHWFQILRTLHIWPTKDSKFVSLEHHTLIVEAPMDGATSTSSLEHMTPKQRSCLDVFTGHFLRLHDSVFACAKNLVFNGHTHLRVFLLDSLKSGGKHTGGLSLITAETVLQSIIKPAYESATVSKEDRVTYCAYLAFLYHCEQNKRDVITSSLLLKHFSFDSVIFPTLRFINQLWDADTNFEARKPSAKRVHDEIHLGAEFTDSAVSMLQGDDEESLSVVMENWCVLDPLVSAFVFGKPAHSLLHGTPLSSASIRAVFNDVGSDEMNRWKEFLLKRGVVNGFGIYDAASPNTASWCAHCPTICIMIARLLKNARFVRTSYSTDASMAKVAPLLCTNSDIEWAAEQDSDVVPLYLHHHSDLVECNVYSVDEEAHQLLWRIANIIAVSLQGIATLKLQNTALIDKVRHGLNTSAWFPIDNHLYYYSFARQALVSDREKYLVIAPCNVVQPKNKKREFILGPHIPYFPSRYGDRLDIPDAFPFMVASAASNPSFAFCVGLYSWIMTISGYLASSSGFMAYLVKQILHGMENETDEVLLIRRVQDLFNPVDSAVVLWVPDAVLRGNDVLESSWLDVKKNYIPGRCYPRARISLRDVDHQLFHVRNSPVKVLKYYFDDQFCGLFTPLEICANCKMVAGEFGCYGKDLGEGRNCSCRLSDSLQALKANKGLFKQLPDALDMLALVEFHQQQAETYPEQAEEIRERIDALLMELGRCVLQSLRDAGGGNPPPFSFRILQELRRRKRDILASFLSAKTGNNTSVGDNANVVAVDDLKLWLAASDAFKASFATVSVLKDPLSSFDLLLASHCLHNCEEKFANLGSMQGRIQVDGIAAVLESWRRPLMRAIEETSATHTSLFALLRFLQVPLLSLTVQEHWLFEECNATKSNQCLALMDRLLHVASLFWFRALKDASQMDSVWNAMMQTSKIRSMRRNLKVKICTKLVRVVTSDSHESFEMAEDFRLSKELLISDANPAPIHAIELLVHQATNNFALAKMLLQVVQHWVLSEIQSSSLLTSFKPSQLHKLAVEFTALLEKYSRVPASVFHTVLSSDDLLSVLDRMDCGECGLWSFAANAEVMESADGATAVEEVQQDRMNATAKDIAALEAILRVNERKPNKERDPSSNFHRDRENHPTEYHPPFPLPPRQNRRGGGIIDLSDIEFDTTQSVKKLAPEELEELNADDIPEAFYVGGDFAANYKTGRIGEFFAYQYFLRHQADMHIQSVCWVNEYQECARPFDVALTLQDGRELQVEVKTHTLADGEHTSNNICRWFVSANEIEHASQQRGLYIAAMLLLKKKASGGNGRYALDSLYLLGLDVEGGLYGALMSQQAKLMLLLLSPDDSNT